MPIIFEIIGFLACVFIVGYLILKMTEAQKTEKPTGASKISEAIERLTAEKQEIERKLALAKEKAQKEAKALDEIKFP